MAKVAQGESRFVPGTLLAGRYRLVALLGRGGMGEVYRAEDVRLGQTVALKFLPEALARDRDSLARFYAEARIGRQVSHPNVCRLYDLIEIDGQHCFAMEYIDGEDLATLLKRIGRLPLDKAMEIAREICAGLSAAHDKGVIHRDLKPANVMIDGKGRVRITDFGIAALADEVANAELAGTPAYMAPEQLRGDPASMQSDLYALGLILFETLTGRPPADAGSNFSTSLREAPLPVQQVIAKCLEQRADARPPSAQAVWAALPGGDPLQAALAAGETPSPAMVAAAGTVGDLKSSLAWAFLVLAVIGLALAAGLAQRSNLLGLLQPEKSQQVLAERAREILGELGYPEKSNFEASHFFFDQDYLEYRSKEYPEAVRWEGIAEARPGPLLFLYRSSPRTLIARHYPLALVTVGSFGRVERDDPAHDVPGMATVELDRHGGLRTLFVVPERTLAAPVQANVDWTPALLAAGLDVALLQPVAAQQVAPVDSDSKAAWNGVFAGQPEVPIHVEAAALRGRIVWFVVQGPWQLPKEVEASIGRSDNLMPLVVLLFSLMLGLPIIVFGRRNLLLGRGDRRGAWRLAVFVFVALSLSMFVRADHSSRLVFELALAITIFGQAFYFAALNWITYLAFEPAARRRWPQLMIAWSRLLGGQLRDPLVGRELLLGVLAGITMLLLLQVGVLSPSLPGIPPRAPLAFVTSTLGSSPDQLFFLLVRGHLAVGLAFGALFGLMVVWAIVRVRLLAILAMWGMVCIFFLGSTGASMSWAPETVLLATLWFAVLIRVGFWSSVVAAYVFFVLYATPLTLDFGAWHSGSALLTLTVLTVLLLYGFHTALAGKSLLGDLMSEQAGADS